MTPPDAPGLIAAARDVLRPHRVGGRVMGDVAAVLETPTGQRFAGVHIDTACGTGACAEHAAVAAMVTAGQYRIAAITAVWRDGDGRLVVLPPCGRCREFLRQVDPGNLDTAVVLGPDRVVPLRDLLPAHVWPAPLDEELLTPGG